jgi:sodium-dependent dicarboxylate transporter 2/3/5
VETTEKIKTPKRNLKPIWVALAFVVMIVIIFLPNPTDLPVMGQRALAILAFAVILWMTEAVSYPVSASMIISLIALLLGLAPSMEDPNVLLGTKNSLKMALGGFSNSAVALVAAALFLAAAMQATNLHKRLAMFVLSKVGVKTVAIVFGAILVSIVLAFFVPSATARA